MKIAILGSGVVGDTLARGFLGRGHAVMRGTRDPAKLAAWKEGSGEHASIGAVDEAARWGDVVVLAVKGTAAEQVIASAGPDNLAGKTVIDTTNPIADAPPVNGVLQYFTAMNDSLMERLQRVAPRAHFVKAFSCVGNAFMIDPPFQPTPTMFICGDDAGAKREVTDLLTAFGWETADMGAVEAARAIEPLCILWCIPGLRGGGWSHAFKLLGR